MGKNRKPKQVVNQGLQQSGPEEEDVCCEEIPVGFLTSDNFCLVQKKKSSRRSEDQCITHRSPRSRSNSGKIVLSDEASSVPNNGGKTGHHTSFWTNRSKQLVCRDVEEVSDFSLGEGDARNIIGKGNELNSVSASCGPTQLMKDDETEYCASSDVVQECSNTQGGASQMDTFCFNYDDVLSGLANAKTGFELLRCNESPEESFVSEISDPDDKDMHYPNGTDTNSSVSPFAINHSKTIKKTKRKERKKKKAIEDDIDALLLELESCNEGSGKVTSSDRNTNCVDTILQNNFIPNATKDKTISHVMKDCKILKEKELKSVNNVLSRTALDDTEVCSKCSEIFVSSETHERENQSSNEDLSTMRDFAVLGEHTTKTVVQKKKDRKTREKQKRLVKYETDSKKICECGNTVVKVVSCNQGAEVLDFHSIGEENEKNKVDEPEKKDRKRLGKKQLAAIQEALKKAKEEEEKLKKAEEARQKAAEEAEKLRQEKLRLEQERKEKKKLKEKQRRDKMKAEGRLLSKSQKQSRARMEATLAALRQQGINIPEIGEKKPHGPRLGNYKPYRKRLDSTQSNQSSDNQVSKSERQKSESLSSQESYGRESLSDLPSSYDSKSSWDTVSMEAALTTESEGGHLSCSDESDVLEENCPPNNCALTEDLYNIKLKIPLANSGNVKMGLSLRDKPRTCTVESEGTRSDAKLRSPVVCVLGHVDTGKTKILDYIRKTHVQDAEAGGITQQIGATMIPRDAIKEKCKMVRDFLSFELKVPGLLVIDTPGHESFSNLRSRGSSICDIAILVVDIMHGIEAQTLESINLLKRGKTPFVVALNKIDRIYGWKSINDDDIENVIKSQTQCVQLEFRKRCQEIVLQFANECLNATLFYENKDPRTFVSMVPTSAVTGDGMGNILSLVVKLTQTLMFKKLIFSEELKVTVLEVKAISGLGTTIDVILVNGRLQEGDTIVLAGHDGPIVTQIRSLLMPQPLRELRVKNPYIEYKTIEGAQGVKITGRDLDKAIAGLPLLVAQNYNKVDILKEEINYLFRDRMNSIKTSERGVYVQASTLGSLEALLEYLSASEIPYFGVKIGPVVKKDVMKASIMLEHDSQYAVILAFDVKIERDAQELADSLGVQIFQADIIYHLCDKYMKYREELQLRRREEIRRLAVYPCKLKILPQFVFSVRDPIVLGVSVEAGTLKEGTPLCVPSKDNLEIGTVSTIEVNNKIIDCAKKGQEVCIKIEPKSGDSPKMYGKHFDHEHLLVSRITRQSIDICKEHFRDNLDSSDWHLMVELKKMLHIV